MAFPATPLLVVQQLYINGAWVDITTDTRGNNGNGGVAITRGYSGEQAQLSAGTAQFTINNRDGKYTNDNPISPYYRKLGRNTPYRTGIDSSLTSARSARFPGGQAPGTINYDGSVIWTADKAGLDIVGDIDVAVDVEFNGTQRDSLLLSKYLISGNQRSWILGLDYQGRIFFLWSTDGTDAGRITATCPVVLDPMVGRMQLHAQLDVNNGSGGWTVTFQQGFGTSLNPTWVTLGTTSGTGVTSIFSSSARVEVGDGNNAAGSDGTLGRSDPFVGKMYGAFIRNGIGGTLVANANIFQQTPGTTTWADNSTLANTWTLAGPVAIESIDFRFYGEIPSLPNRWDISGTDVYIPVTANDIIARATTGNLSKPLHSSVFANLSRYPWDGYWPMEQPLDSTTISAFLGQAGRKTNADFSVPTDFPGTAGSMSFSDDTGTATGTATRAAGAPTLATYMLYFKLNTVPATLQTVLNFFITGGTAARITLRASTTQYSIDIVAADGTSLAGLTSSFGGTNQPNQWTAMRVKLSSSGGTVTWEMAWYQINQPDVWGISGTYAGTVGNPYYWSTSAGWTGKSGMQLAHVAMGRLDPDFTSSTFIDATNAYNLEAWDVRVKRLGAQTLLPVFVEGSLISASAPNNTHSMGPQGLKTPVELLQECADVAGGMLYVPRDKSGITIRSWEQMINQTPAVFDYALNHLSGSLQPEPDLFLVENDVTLQTPDGSTYRYVKTTGTLNVGDPGADPDAVGTYDVGPVSINLGLPADMPQYAQRRVLLGTWDEARYPQAQVQLERGPFVASTTLTDAARRLDLGRAFTIANPPTWLPPGNIDLMVVGYVETMGGMTDTLNFNTRPGGPYRTGRWGSATIPTTSLWGAGSTTLKTGVTTTAVSLTFTTPNRLEQWSTTATGYHVKIGGETMTISAMGARTGTGPYEQIATVIRSVNLVIKAQSGGSPVTVVEQGRWS